MDLGWAILIVGLAYTAGMVYVNLVNIRAQQQQEEEQQPAVGFQYEPTSSDEGEEESWP